MISSMNKSMIFVLGVFLCLPAIHAQDIEITHKEAGSHFRLENNISLDYSGDVSIFGDIELNKRYGGKAGLALGWLDEDFEIKAFGSLRFAPLLSIPLNVNLMYNYNGLPGDAYDCHTHSLLPYVSYNAKWAGISLGINLRFTSFFGEKAIFESMLSFSGYVNCVNTEKLLVGFRFANFNDFYIKNMAAYHIGLYYTFRVTEQWSIASELEFMQTGGGGLTTIFYGFTYRGGVTFTW